MRGYFGGKAKQSVWIRKNAPDLTKITKMVSLFSGSNWEYFRNGVEYPYIERICYNDFNRLHMNTLRCFTFQNEFKKEWSRVFDGDGILAFENQSKEDVLEIYKTVWKGWKLELKAIHDSGYESCDLNRPDFHLAIKYLFVWVYAANGFSPIADEQFSFSFRCKNFSNGEIIPNSYHLPHNSELKKVLRHDKPAKNYYKKLLGTKRWECMDFEDMFNQVNESETYVYADPPYLNKKGTYASDGKSPKEDEHGLCELDYRVQSMMQTANCKMTISYSYDVRLEWLYPRDEYRWEVKDFPKPTANHGGDEEKKMITEVLIMNYDPEHEKVKVLNDELDLPERLERVGKLVSIVRQEIPEIFKKRGKKIDKEGLVVRDKKRHGYRFTSSAEIAIVDLIVNHGWSKIKAMREFGVGSYNTIDKMISKRLGQVEIAELTDLENKKVHHSAIVKRLGMRSNYSSNRISVLAADAKKGTEKGFEFMFPHKHYHGFVFAYRNDKLHSISVSNLDGALWEFRYHGDLLVKFDSSNQVVVSTKKFSVNGKKRVVNESLKEVCEICEESTLEELLNSRYEIDMEFHAQLKRLTAA